MWVDIFGDARKKDSQGQCGNQRDGNSDQEESPGANLRGQPKDGEP